MARILIVDDEPKLGRVLVEMLEGAGHEVTRAGGGREALVQIGAQPPDVVLTDLRMPDVDGMAVLRETKQRSPGTDVVIMTAHATAQSAVAPTPSGPLSVAEKNEQPASTHAMTKRRSTWAYRTARRVPACNRSRSGRETSGF